MARPRKLAENWLHVDYPVVEMKTNGLSSGLAAKTGGARAGALLHPMTEGRPKTVTMDSRRVGTPSADGGELPAARGDLPMKMALALAIVGMVLLIAVVSVLLPAGLGHASELGRLTATMPVRSWAQLTGGNEDIIAQQWFSTGQAHGFDDNNMFWNSKTRKILLMGADHGVFTFCPE